MTESSSHKPLEAILSLNAQLCQIADAIGSGAREIPVFGPMASIVLNNAWSKLGLQLSCAAGRWEWKREIVLITGGCSGIGEQMARKFAGRDIKVVVLDIAEPKTPLPTVHFYKCDITSPDAVHATAKRIRKDVGDPSVLINNAGIGTAKTVLEETNEEIQRVFDVNSVAHFWMTREFLPFMIQQNHGHVVTVASMASFVTIASNVSYSCTKAGALSFHEGLAQELRHRYKANKVRTSVIHPSWVRTPLIETLTSSGRWNSKTIEADYVADSIVSHIIAGRSGQIFLPGGYSVASLVKAFPSWLQERIRDSQKEVLQYAH